MLYTATTSMIRGGGGRPALRSRPQSVSAALKEIPTTVCLFVTRFVNGLHFTIFHIVCLFVAGFVQPVYCATIHNTLKNISIDCDTLCSFSVNLTIPNDSLSVSHCSVTHPTPALVCISQIGKKDP